VTWGHDLKDQPPMVKDYYNKDDKLVNYLRENNWFDGRIKISEKENPVAFKLLEGKDVSNEELKK
jgi:hypothetical protein